MRRNVLTAEEQAAVVAFRKHTLLPVDDCLYALQATIPQLTRSSLHRCYQRHGISRLPEIEGERALRGATFSQLIIGKDATQRVDQCRAPITVRPRKNVQGGR